MKITLVSNNKKFDIEKAMHLDQTDANNTVSATFKVYGNKTDWDIVRYSYTLWKQLSQNDPYQHILQLVKKRIPL